MLLILFQFPEFCFFHPDIDFKLQFYEHEADFEKLVAMAREDPQMTRIAEDFTWLDTDVSWPRDNIGISNERWDEYRKLFRKVGAHDGIVNRPDISQVIFLIVEQGIVPAGQAKGIVYSYKPVIPVLSSLDRRPPWEMYDSKGDITAYTRITGNWYIYFEDW